MKKNTCESISICTEQLHLSAFNCNIEIYNPPPISLFYKMDEAQKSEIEMNLTCKNIKERKDSIIFPEWYNPDYYQYRLLNGIDFFNFSNDYYQTKIKLHILDVSFWGWDFAVGKIVKEIKDLNMKYENLGPLERKDADNTIEKLREKMDSYWKRQGEVTCAKDETTQQYSKYLKIELKNQFKNVSITTSERIYFEKPKREPFNDPDNDFGWKNYCDLCKQLSTEFLNNKTRLENEEEDLDESIESNNNGSDISNYYDYDMKKENNCPARSLTEAYSEYNYKTKKALLEICKKYFLGDLSESIYDGLDYFTYGKITK